MTKIINTFLIALSFVTIFPVDNILSKNGQNNNYNESKLGNLSIFLPFIGLLIGLFLLVSYILLSHFSSNRILIYLIIIVLWLLLTGGIHFDGLMDTFDGICSHKDIATKLKIMQDSRVGNFGALSGFIVFLLKLSSFLNLDQNVVYIALLTIPISSRLAEVFAISKFDYIKQNGLGKVWHDNSKYPNDYILGLLLLITVTLTLSVLFHKNLTTLFVANTSIGLIVASYFNKTLGGHTGDTYGATVEITEALCLVAISFLY